MTTFNDEQYLEDAVESVLTQTFSNFELLIADDGSKDETQQILKDYAEKDKRIRLSLNNVNKGQAYRLNQLLMKTRGEYIARMDADDVALPERFVTQLKYFEKNSNLKLLGTQMYLWDGEGKAKKTLPIDSFSIRFYALLNNPFSHPSVMWKNGLIEKYPDLEVAQDYALWSELIYKYEAANTKEVLILNRQHKQSKSARKIDLQRKVALDIAKNNLVKILPNWNHVDIGTLHSFLKRHPNEVDEVIRGWNLYKKLVKAFGKKYPNCWKSFSFVIFLTKITLNQLWIKFSIVTWSGKFKLLVNLA